uniref:Uncharacterized protein n=1 Tax=Arcella intermedia TaxID=1963864 RepID=A0A6B2LL86_9EUKA
MFKVVFVGDLGYGKSSIILQYLEKTFTGEECSSIGADFRVKTIQLDNKKKVKLQLWDAAGQEKFRTICILYYRGAHLVVIVLDVTDSTSLNNLDKWVQEMKQQARADLQFLVVGNKIDLVDQRKITESDVNPIMTRIKCNYLYRETSAKDGTGIDELFKEIALLLVNQKEENSNFIGLL